MCFFWNDSPDSSLEIDTNRGLIIRSVVYSVIAEELSEATTPESLAATGETAGAAVK